jgi:D-glycero-D-manno-heptose 1,7-bisphosphate phosphatase
VKRAVFLDRDGVLNRAHLVDGVPHPPARAAELELLPGVVEATRQLAGAGFLLIVVTNQPDIARGTTTAAEVEAIHQALRSQLPLDDVRVCPHDDADRCACRKPLPGLLLEAARDHDVALSSSVMVGDRWRDVEAGRRAGTKTIYVRAADYNETLAEGYDLAVPSLLAGVPWILGLEATA